MKIKKVAILITGSLLGLGSIVGASVGLVACGSTEDTPDQLLVKAKAILNSKSPINPTLKLSGVEDNDNHVNYLLSIMPKLIYSPVAPGADTDDVTINYGASPEDSLRALNAATNLDLSSLTGTQMASLSEDISVFSSKLTELVPQFYGDATQTVKINTNKEGKNPFIGGTITGKRGKLKSFEGDQRLLPYEQVISDYLNLYVSDSILISKGVSLPPLSFSSLVKDKTLQEINTSVNELNTKIKTPLANYEAFSAPQYSIPIAEWTVDKQVVVSWTAKAKNGPEYAPTPYSTYTYKKTIKISA